MNFVVNGIVVDDIVEIVDGIVETDKWMDGNG